MPKLLFVLGFLFALSAMQAQEENPTERETDSLRNFMEGQGITVEEVTKRASNPLTPSKAAFYSAVLPGLGQAYNKRYWKVPIVWAAIGTGVYVYMFNDDLYDRTRTAFKRRRAGFTDDEFYDLSPNDNFVPSTPDFSTEALQDAQERYQRDRDLALLVTIGLYALNIIDANVDAHLKQYNVNEDLSLHFEPYLDIHPISAEASYGIGLAIRF